MSRCIIRALWGKADKSNRVLWRKHRVDSNIRFLLNNKYQDDFITYVWGQDNYNTLKELGVKNIHMVSKDYQQWDLVKFQYRHKIEACRIAMEVDGFDQIISCDWDCFLIKPWSDNIWTELEKKEKFQACLMQYKKIKCGWRLDKKDIRKTSNGGFLWMADKTIPSQIIKVWESDKNTNKRSLEPCMSLWLDKLNNGWIGIKEYEKRYEPTVCDLYRNGVYDKSKENIYYSHWAGLGEVK